MMPHSIIIHLFIGSLFTYFNDPAGGVKEKVWKKNPPVQETQEISFYWS
jgi:hypothetical protein